MGGAVKIWPFDQSHHLSRDPSPKQPIKKKHAILCWNQILFNGKLLWLIYGCGYILVSDMGL
jgi:hypothetical protein